MSELHVRNIVNDLQIKYQTHFDGEAWDYVRKGLNGAKERHCESLKFERDLYKKLYDDQLNACFLYNELKLWVREQKKASREDILQVILQQEMKGTKAKLRDIRVG